MILLLLPIAYIIFYFLEGGGSSTLEDFLNIAIVIYVLKTHLFMWSTSSRLEDLSENTSDSAGSKLVKIESSLKKVLDKVESISRRLR